MTMKQVLSRIAKSKDIEALKSPLREIKKELAAMRKTNAWYNRVMAKSRLEDLS